MSLINNKKHISQILSFDGLEVGKIYPTDIDFVLEFDNEFLILGEVKKYNKKLPTGQKLVYQRILDKWHLAGGRGIFMKVSHESGEDVVNLKDCIVREIYMSGDKWRTPKGSKTVDWFLSYIGKKWDIKKLNRS